ncbi:MAG TPA: SLC13 family permease [Woeseiaceae bacterium]|nr:SLC13 family permease [Woeseiaceae bacterium]
MSLSLHAIAAIVLTVGALILISRDKVPLEYSAAAILVVAVVGFELFPVPEPSKLRGVNFLAGFGNEALIAICLLLMLAKGVEASGALQQVGRFLTHIWLNNRSLALLATLVFAASVSAFANNTPIVVMLLPILVGVAHRIGTAPSKMLMPVGFATIIGGMSTTIGTSTNLLVVSVAEEMGLPRIGMFDFFVPALFATFVGILYLWLFLPRILPERATPLEGTESRVFESSVVIDAGSALVGMKLPDALRQIGGGIRVLRVQRGTRHELVRLPTLTLKAQDRLFIRGTPEYIEAVQRAAGSPVTDSELKRAPDERLIEIVVTRDSPLHRKHLSELQPDLLRGLYPVGWYRPGQQTMTRIEQSSNPLLRTGDVLLLQGQRQDVQTLMEKANMLVLARTIHVPRVSKAPLSVGIMVGVVIVAALGILPIVASALCGVGLMLVTRCLTWGEAWQAIDTRLALVIVASLALGTALVGTGAAAFLAQSFVLLIEGLPAPVVLSALLLLIALLTEVVTNNAVAIIGTPIAIGVAHQLGLPPTPFVLAVLFGANMSYLTPIGYQTNLLVMSAGGYRFSDFFRGGLPLQILMWLVLSMILTWLYL